jgi:signal transduction histidine kinase
MAERGPVAAMPLAAPQRRRPGLLRRAAAPIVSAQTWLAVIHLMTGAITGAVALAGVIVLTAIGVSTVWFFLAGLPVLVTMLWLCLQFGRFERARFEVLLGVRLPTPPVDLSSGASLWQRLWRLMAERATRRQFGYAVLRFPLGFAEGFLVTAAWSFVLTLLGLPLFSWWLLHHKWHVSTPVPYLGEMFACAVLGLLLLPVPAQLTRGLASLDIAVARHLIGPGGSTDQTERITELERSRARVVDAAEAERRRIERDLHDGAQQRLVSLAMNLGRAKARFADDPDAARDIIDQAHTEAKEALAELRNLVRGVHPPVLTDRGLDAAISGLAALCPVPVTVRADTGPRPPASAEANAYFVVAEALTNVAKHAHASRADVLVTRHGDVLRVLIRDDGVGGADPRGQGLAGLADRLAGVDGRLSVRSPDGGPTVIEAELPCRS